MSWRLAAALVASGALGCGGGDAPELLVCARVDLCATVPVDRVNAACGASATSAAPDGGNSGGNTFDSCLYRSASNVDLLSIDRGCFELASSAAITYGTAHGDTSSGDFVREEIDGLGDRAFVRVNAQAMTSQLNVLSRNLYIFLTSFDVTDAAAAKACMTVLANDVIAAQ